MCPIIARRFAPWIAGGAPGAVYNVGGGHEMPNLEIVKIICALLDELEPSAAGPYARLIKFVQDRPGHDRRYAIGHAGSDRTRARLASGRDVCVWYPQDRAVAFLENQQWIARVRSGEYQKWLELNYGAVA